MDQTPPPNLRTLPIGRKKVEEKPLREFLIRLPSGKTITQHAHDYSELTADTEEGQNILAFAFYVDKQRVLQLCWDPEITIMDTAHVDSEAILAALKKPARRPRKAKS